MDICKGSIVYSAKGHDKGNLFVVLDAEKDFVYLADGKIRRVSKPKKKKIKHIVKTNSVAKLDFDNVSDSSLRKCLSEYSAR